MSNYYDFKKNICDLCGYKYTDFFDEFPELVYTKIDGDKQYKIFKPNAREMSSYEKWRQKVAEDRKSQEKLCFYFIADCGGDSISICKEHFEQILKEFNENS